MRWWRRCRHKRVRCIHGDEIIFGANGRRGHCLDCGRLLKELPLICWHTGLYHSSAVTPER